MQGRQDSPLTVQGIEAVNQLIPQLPTIGTIYSSPSGRTMQTANILFPFDSAQGSQGVEIRCDDRLREIYLGNWEGRLQADLDLEDPEMHSNFWNAPHRFNKQGAETFWDVAERAVGFFQEITGRHPGETIAIVSHTTVIRSMLFSIEPRPMSDFWHPPAIYPASISEVDIIDGVPRILRFGCTAHHDHAHAGAY